ncbi:GAF and ANTAR domain-containing protein [Rhodococcoides navarretei]|uniref:GAF and ANTAR domain-containing protein n=1 Tax=Rhodococcus navarretei TaxID=3128981 RepID=A0ABU9D472_9NOCA
MNENLHAAEQAAADDLDAEVSAAMSLPTRHRSPPSVGSLDQHFGDVFDALETIRAVLLARNPVERVVQGLCEQVVAVIPGADFAGVALLHHEHRTPKTLACSDSRVLDIDSDQYGAGEGPCLDAARGERTICAGMNDITVRWPRFAGRAVDIGVRSYLSAPLTVDSTDGGSLNLYSYDENGFDVIDEVLVTLFVTSVEAAVGSSRRNAEALAEIDGLRQAMIAQGTIEQATGILMAVRAVSPGIAFEALVEQSQLEKLPLALLAARIVDTVVHCQRKER